jgi:hypothetical protein
MTIMIGRGFELEITLGSLFIRMGSFERYWNMQGLPSH